VGQGCLVRPARLRAYAIAQIVDFLGRVYPLRPYADDLKGALAETAGRTRLCSAAEQGAPENQIVAGGRTKAMRAFIAWPWGALDKMLVDPLQARHDIETHTASDIQQHVYTPRAVQVGPRN
jgi:hypothetical protein